MRRVTLAFFVLINVSAVLAQATFDVVSIKRNNSGLPGFTGGLGLGGRLDLFNAPTSRLIRLVYPTPTSELIGAPEWVSSERYDVTAVAAPQTTRAEIQLMLRTMLADRFKLVAHQETRERPTFSLVVPRTDGRLGPQMHRSELDCAAVELANNRREPVPALANGAPPCGFFQQAGVFKAGGITMALFAQTLTGIAGRVVIDKTGLTGNYEMTLKYGSPTSTGAGAADDRPSIFTALQEQLGLKLESSSAPLPVLVIDRIEHPTEN